jgi:hypothetical protein
VSWSAILIDNRAQGDFCAKHRHLHKPSSAITIRFTEYQTQHPQSIDRIDPENLFRDSPTTQTIQTREAINGAKTLQ